MSTIKSPGGDEASSLWALPESIRKVEDAAEHLHRVLYDTDFPDLDAMPSTNAEVEDAVQIAARWAKTIHATYGHGECSDEDYRKSLFQLFRPAETLDHPAALLGGSPPGLWPTDCDYFEFAFTPEQAICREDYADSLLNPDARGINFTTDNWDEIRRRLQIGYARIVRRALANIAWIRNRIEELRSSILPDIKTLRQGSHNSIFVEVRQAGGKKEIRLTGAEAQFLSALAVDDIATALRGTKSSLVKKLPELQMWIEVTDRGRNSDDDNRAEYKLAQELRSRVAIEYPEK